MILSNGAEQAEFYADENFSIKIWHDSSSVMDAGGMMRFVDRMFTTYSSTFTITDTLENIEVIANWLSDNYRSQCNVQLFYGEEAFGPHFEIDPVNGSTFPVIIKPFSEVSRINLRQASMRIELGYYSVDRTSYPLRTDLQPTLDNLQYPHNYTPKNAPVFAQAEAMDSSNLPTTLFDYSQESIINFTVTTEELAELLLFWEDNRHTSFAVPTIAAPYFIPGLTTSGLAISNVGDVIKNSRHLWTATVTFVPAEFGV